MRTITLTALSIAGALIPIASATTAVAATDSDQPFRATFVERDYVTNCDPGTSCGFGNVAGVGHVARSTVEFGACGTGCEVRTLYFDDASTLVMHEIPRHWFVPSGNSGGRATAAPASLPIDVTIVEGTGRFADASGTATGVVRVTRDDARVTMTGSWDY